MYRISKEFGFEASHQLHGLPEGHQCGRLHGHSYRVRLTLESSSLDSIGFVVDFGELKAFKVWIDENLDHRHLNNILNQPTAENLARFLWNSVRANWPNWPLQQVAVSETQKTWATFTGEV